MAKQPEIPIQPVKIRSSARLTRAGPALALRHEDRHPEQIPCRRHASYWFKTQRTGSAQMSLLAEEERDDLPLVNALREDVRRWHDRAGENASETTKTLFRHWWREDRGAAAVLLPTGSRRDDNLSARNLCSRKRNALEAEADPGGF